MEPTYDSRGQETAATEKTAVTGGNGTREPAKAGSPQSGATRSWRQYIDQTMPIRDTGAEAKQENAGVPQADPAAKKRTRTARERYARRTVRWARESGEKARSFAGTAREKLGSAANLCREKLGAAAGTARQKLGTGAEKLGRGVETVRAAVARHPVSPLLYVTLLAVFIGVAAFQGNYARAYVLEYNNQELGLVAGEDEVNALLSNVENRTVGLYGVDFDYDDVNVTLSPVYASLNALTDSAEMEDALIEAMGVYAAAEPLIMTVDKRENEVTTLTAWALSVDGEYMGIAPSKDVFYQMLDEIAQPWLPANAVRYEFLEDVRVYPVALPLDAQFDDLESIREELSALRVEEAVYTVVKGDTFNAIAYSLGMKPYELAALNPNIKVDMLMIGQKLVIQQSVPRLSVLAITDETYEEVIPSPVEYIETADLYIGSYKVKTQGADGLALVNAHVTYLNNQEVDREVVESTTLKEATTTYT